MQTVNISDLTVEQLAALKAQLKAQAKANGANLKERNAIIDRMLTEKDGTEFRHTTADILAALQTAKIVEATLAKVERAEWLKKIQTRKQLLEKQANEDGTPKYAKGTFGYKASAHVIGALTPDRVVDWLMDDAHVATLTASDRKAIIKALSTKN